VCRHHMFCPSLQLGHRVSQHRHKHSPSCPNLEHMHLIDTRFYNNRYIMQLLQLSTILDLNFGEEKLY
jgi:hypothetical protein